MRIKCIFTDNLIRRPILYELSKQFAIVTNIYQASVTSDSGWVVLDVTGEREDLIKGLEWLRESEVQVEILEEEE